MEKQEQEQIQKESGGDATDDGSSDQASYKADAEKLVANAIDVKLDTLYIFPSTLLHQPNISPLSTLNRITAAGNILIPASEKSLLSE